MARDLALLVPEMTLMIAIVLALCAEMLRAPRLALLLMLVGLALASGLTLPVLEADTTVFGGTYRIDYLSGWAKLILLPATAFALLLARTEVAGSDHEGSVYSLLGLVSAGALMLSGAGDMMLIALGVLLSGLGSFALVAYPRDDAGTEASMKFFVFASVAGAIMVYGLTFWFGGTGSTLLSELGRLEGQPIVAAAGLVAVLVGLGYKAGLVPFHFWAPDAYDGAPVSVAAYLSVVPKIAAIFALAQVVRDLPTETGWPFLIAGIAALTMTYGYLAALVQTNIVRLLAYSSVAQAGYFLLGIVAVGTTPLALQSIMLFGAAYAAMNIGAFAIVMAVGRNLDDITTMGRRMPVAGVAMVILLLSLAGIPPLFGFVGKVMLFGAAIEAGFLWLAVIGIINSVLSLAVYLRIIVPMYHRREDTMQPLPDPGGLVVVVWGVATVVTLGLGLGAQLLLG
jgi:NADH-quinone oxidoreductase subunit N